MNYICKRGHDRKVVGLAHNRRCKQCYTEDKAEYLKRRREAEVERKRLAALVADLIDADVAGMRERAQAARCVDCGGHGHVDMGVGRLCYACRGRRVERMRAA